MGADFDILGVGHVMLEMPARPSSGDVNETAERCGLKIMGVESLALGWGFKSSKWTRSPNRECRQGRGLKTSAGHFHT